MSNNSDIHTIANEVENELVPLTNEIHTAAGCLPSALKNQTGIKRSRLL